VVICYRSGVSQNISSTFDYHFHEEIIYDMECLFLQLVKLFVLWLIGTLELSRQGRCMTYSHVKHMHVTVVGKEVVTGGDKSVWIVVSSASSVCGGCWRSSCIV
jgi:hypothetical protein